MTASRNDSQLNLDCFVNAPLERLQQDLLPVFLKHRLQPEIGLEGADLWQQNADELSSLAALLRDNDLTCTLHAPFHDLAPGGIEKRIVELSREKLGRAFALISVFAPRSIVCHLGYEEQKHGADIDRWLEVSLTTWIPLLKVADEAGIQVMFENTYEKTPAVHKRFFLELERNKYKNFGFCLDTGHLLSFAHSPWQPWLEALGPWLGQLHLHDNDGHSDQHRAIGTGVFPFAELFTHLHQHEITPIITLEPHSEEDLWLSLENISKMGLFG